MTTKWIFEDLMPGDVFKCVKGHYRGKIMTLLDIDYKKRLVTLDRGDAYLIVDEKDFVDGYNFIKWHND